MNKIFALALLVMAACAPRYGMTDGPFRLRMHVDRPTAEVGVPFVITMRMDGILPVEGSRVLIEVTQDGDMVYLKEGSFYLTTRYFPVNITFSRYYWCREAYTPGTRADEFGMPPIDYTGREEIENTVKPRIEVLFYAWDAEAEDWRVLAKQSREVVVTCYDCSPYNCASATAM